MWLGYLSYQAEISRLIKLYDSDWFTIMNLKSSGIFFIPSSPLPYKNSYTPLSLQIYVILTRDWSGILTQNRVSMIIFLSLSISMIMNRTMKYFIKSNLSFCLHILTAKSWSVHFHFSIEQANNVQCAML